MHSGLKHASTIIVLWVAVMRPQKISYEKRWILRGLSGREGMSTEIFYLDLSQMVDEIQFGQMT